MKGLGSWTGTTEGSLVNRTQDMEDRISGTKDMIEGIDTSVKENVKSEKILTQHFQEIWDTMKRPSLRIIGIEGEETQMKDRKCF